MMAMKRGRMLVSVLLALLSGCAECAAAQAPLAVTTVQDTVYTASGAAASGTVLVSWPGFTTASGAVVPAGTMSATIGTGGLLSLSLAPNAGATPIGSYYTATFHLSDGSTSREFWVVPVTLTGGTPVTLAAIQNRVLPTSVAMQTVSKTYVDMAIAAAVTGHPADSSTPYLLKAGDTMTGPLVLSANPVSANQAADKNYVDETVNAARPPVFGASGSSHAAGLVPDPGSTAGATHYLREDGTWDVPSAGGSGTMSTQNASAVAITGGTIDGTVIGGATPAAATFTSFTDGYISYSLAQINRPTAAIELQYGGSTGEEVRIGGAGSNPVTFYADTGTADIPVANITAATFTTLTQSQSNCLAETTVTVPCLVYSQSATGLTGTGGLPNFSAVAGQMYEMSVVLTGTTVGSSGTAVAFIGTGPGQFVNGITINLAGGNQMGGASTIASGDNDGTAQSLGFGWNVTSNTGGVFSARATIMRLQ